MKSRGDEVCYSLTIILKANKRRTGMSDSILTRKI